MPHVFKRKLHRFIRPFSFLGFLCVCVVILLISYRQLFPYLQFARANSIDITLISNFITGKIPTVRTFKDRMNMVILGIGGEGHEGSDLTDTIIFISIDLLKKDVVSLSIPRDVWIPSMKAKINAAYHYGNEKKENGGFILAKAAVEEVIGIPIQYVTVIDFNNFKRLIDLLGGVDVNVEVTFDDNKYPIEGKENDLCGGDQTFSCRYEHIRFEKGKQSMDGEKALKYVRSRESIGNEGTDYARGKRQQLVINAIKEKITKLIRMKDFNSLIKIAKFVNSVIVTDLTLREKISCADYFLRNKNFSVRKLVLDEGNSLDKKPGYLTNPPIWQYNGAWVLIPRTGDFEEIHSYVACNLDTSACLIKPSSGQ